MSFVAPKLSGSWSEEQVLALQERFEDRDATDLLTWADRELDGPVMLASSFGLEDVVLIDLVARLDLDIQVFSLDTGRLHQETYDVIEAIRRRYEVDIAIYFPDTTRVEAMVREKGPNSFYDSVENRKECCYLRKVEPLKRALDGSSAWVTGLRRDQNVTRNKTPKIEIDRGHRGILKLNPLADWSANDVRQHIERFDVPYNELHDRGFPSIGCAPCTRPVEAGEDPRAGRWWWENPESKECGLHTKASRGSS